MPNTNHFISHIVSLCKLLSTIFYIFSHFFLEKCAFFPFTACFLALPACSFFSKAMPLLLIMLRFARIMRGRLWILTPSAKRGWTWFISLAPLFEGGKCFYRPSRSISIPTFSAAAMACGLPKRIRNLAMRLSCISASAITSANVSIKS